MSRNINKGLVDFSSPNLHGPSTLNYPTNIQQIDSSTILAIANKKRNTVAKIKSAQSWSDYLETTSYRLRLDVSMYPAIIIATCSTPNETQLTQHPSLRETIRQQNSRPGVRLPHLIGRRSTKTRAGPLARRYPKWTLREVPSESSTIVDARKPRISLDILVPQIGTTNRSEGLENFLENRRQYFREVRLALEKRHQSKVNARLKANNKIIRESAGNLAQIEDLVLVEKLSSNIERNGSGGNVERE